MHVVNGVEKLQGKVNEKYTLWIRDIKIDVQRSKPYMQMENEDLIYS